MDVSIIVAMTPQRVIGQRGQLPWHLSADLQRFKRLTMGHHIVMGRKTYDSIGRLLPGRKTVVVTRQTGLLIPGADVVCSIAEAQQCCQQDTEAFYVGGQQIYREALKFAQRVYLTLVQAQVEGDAFFPSMPAGDWELTDEQPHTADERNEYDYSFQVWDRR